MVAGFTAVISLSSTILISPTITNCTISGNTATYGGGIYCRGFWPVVINSILWGDSPCEIDLSAGTGITVTYSDVQGGWPGSPDPTNIDSDPQFVNAAGSDYHLQSYSPCIDKGTSDGAPSKDIEGIARPQGSGYDMGAYEYVFPFTTTTVVTTSTIITTSSTSTVVISSTTTSVIPTTTTVEPTTTTTSSIALCFPGAGTPQLEMITLINNWRVAQGLSPLAPDPRLEAAAQLHSQDMATNSFCGHVGSNGSSFVERILAQGYSPATSELIGCGYTTATQLMNAWLADASHRNDLSQAYHKHIGVGLINNYWTVEFGAATDGPSCAAVPTTTTTSVIPTTTTVEPTTTTTSSIALCFPGAGTPQLEMITLINNWRVAQGLSPLAPDPRLEAAAQLHSQDMATNSFCGHVGSNGSSFVERILAQGYSPATSELIGCGYTTATQLMNAWLADASHRNDLSQAYHKHIGVGLVSNQWTADFGAATDGPSCGAVPTTTTVPVTTTVPPTTTTTSIIDSDGDGVPDCPVQPLSVQQGTCSASSDKPGIACSSDADCAEGCSSNGQCLQNPEAINSEGACDSCPYDPDKTEPGICGCGVADTDSDGDGVANCNDLCSNDPDKIEPGICGCGVADDIDSDGDSVPDCTDNCPTVANPDQADSDGDGKGNVCEYVFDGFFEPINNGDIVNVAKAGQAIPVKWRLTDYGNGTPISDPASFVGLYSYSVSCIDFTGDPTDVVEEYASGASGLQYKGDGYWQYNWKTSKTYVGQCRQMYIKFSGGMTSPFVKFKFK